MALEDLTGTDKYIANLINTNPLSADDRREGDDHIRGIKNVLLNTFGALSGPASNAYVAKAGDTMGGALGLIDGTAEAPALNFGSEPGLGFHRGGPSSLGLSAQGLMVGYVSAITPGSTDARFNPRVAGAAGLSLTNQPAGTVDVNGVQLIQQADGSALLGTFAGGVAARGNLTIDAPTVLAAHDLVAARNGPAGAAGQMGLTINGTEQSVWLYSSPAYRLGMNTASGSTFLMTNGVTRSFWNVDNGFYHTGQGFKPGGGAWADTSDERIKENIRPYRAGLDEVCALQPVSYTFKKATGRDSSKRYVRLLAQQARAVWPELVTVAPGSVGNMEFDDLHELDESPVLWGLVNAVKALRERIEALELLCAGVGDA